MVTLVDRICEADEQTTAIAEMQKLLHNYQTTRQEYADRVTETKAALDVLVRNSQVALKSLRDALNAAYPA
jgi:2-polyprenyl-6-methoxyphenol hydroxylase-like FAD-dependent oxidoreductase